MVTSLSLDAPFWRRRAWRNRWEPGSARGELRSQQPAVEQRAERRHHTVGAEAAESLARSLVGGDGDHRHAGGAPGRNALRVVDEADRVGRLDTEPPAGGKEQVRCRADT